MLQKTYGYVRVSSREQNIERQLIAMKEVGIEEKQLFIDKQSGKDFDRPAYRGLVKKLREGDLLYVKSIDRLGRNYKEIQDQWRILTKDKKIDIVVIDLPLLDTRCGKDLMGTFISDLVLQLLCFVAENERITIKQRQKEGIEAAQARGVKFGRPMIPIPDNFYEIHKLWKERKITAIEAARTCNMAKTTFLNKAKKFEGL